MFILLFRAQIKIAFSLAVFDFTFILQTVKAILADYK